MEMKSIARIFAQAFFWLFLFSFLPLLASAQDSQPYHLKLLAVQETAEGMEGSDADLYLELKEGSGRVFLETYPLTKLDTQISTRFAKQVACQHFKLDCSQYDFIFTIKAKSNIVGGPSAGAAIAALTAIAVLDLEHDEETSITATINSGGIIGNVGGIKEKLESASQSGLKKVLIPEGSASLPVGENETLNLTEYGKNNLSLEVVEAASLDDVLFHLTGQQLNHRNFTVEEDAAYTEIMGGLQELLCQRMEKIEEELAGKEIVFEEGIREEIIKKKGQAANATSQGDYYSAASYCFGNNILLKKYYYQQEDPSKFTLAGLFNVLEKKIISLEKSIALEKIETISDLQTLMIVKERLSDVREQLGEFKENAELETAEELSNLLAYAEERYYSALSWKQFFAMEGKKFVLDQQSLGSTCQQKVSEAEERHQYVSLFVGETHTLPIFEKIETAKNSSGKSDFELCLIMAAQAKAEANAILSSLGLSDESVPGFLESKQKAVERIIFENSQEDIFPILGYSYYQYAKSMKVEQPYNALVYFEYALEMSDLGIYFPEEKADKGMPFVVNDDLWFVLVGLIIGLFIGYGMKWGKNNKKDKKALKRSGKKY